MEKTLLFVEDDEATSYIYQYVLRKIEFKGDYKIINNGEDAISALLNSEFAPDIIFLDINMPRINGFEFLDALKEKYPLKEKNSLVFMLTNSLNPDDEKRAMEYPEVKGFLSKPLTKETLLEIIN